MTAKTKLSIIIVLAFLGIINAFYLSYEAYTIMHAAQNSIFGTSFCDLSESISCSNFLAHDRSRVFGIPFPWIAAVVYPVLFGLSLFAFFKKNLNTVKVITVMAFGGLAFNGFVISQEIIVGIFCPLCMMCTAYITIIGILGALIWKSGNEKFLASFIHSKK